VGYFYVSVSSWTLERQKMRQKWMMNWNRYRMKWSCLKLITLRL
jgi:hypothetical protein